MMDTSTRSRIVLLATGGTIAGLRNQSISTQTTLSYTAAQLKVDDLLHNAPQIENLLASAQTQLFTQQILSCDSKDMNAIDWLHIARECFSHLQQEKVQAVIVTHGTDTLEESAWALHRLLPNTDKPVILVSAMRPADAPDADGPHNLQDAIIAALDNRLYGVISIAGGELHWGQHVRKQHPYRIHAFTSGEIGPLGWIEGGQVRLAQNIPPANDLKHASALPTSLQAKNSLHAISSSNQWTNPAQYAALIHAAPDILPPTPQVAWLTSHAGFDAKVVEALVHAGMHGLMVAATGNGTLHCELATALRKAAQLNCCIWVTSRCAHGVIVQPNPAETSEPWLFCPLPAAKARSEMVLYLWLQKLAKNIA